jgi:hypothetical protein
VHESSNLALVLASPVWYVMCLTSRQCCRVLLPFTAGTSIGDPVYDSTFSGSAVMTMPYSAAGQSVTLDVSAPAGAAAVESNGLGLSFFLPSRGNTILRSVTITSEDTLTVVGPLALTLKVPLSNDVSWGLTVSGAVDDSFASNNTGVVSAGYTLAPIASGTNVHFKFAFIGVGASVAGSSGVSVTFTETSAGVWEGDLLLGSTRPSVTNFAFTVTVCAG